jgi:hypothetical protein
VSDWQPIETAPDDGTEFQAWAIQREPTENWPDGWWEPRARVNPETEAREVWDRVDYDAEGWTPEDRYWHVTHWQPVPEPPK